MENNKKKKNSNNSTKKRLIRGAILNDSENVQYWIKDFDRKGCLFLLGQQQFSIYASEGHSYKLNSVHFLHGIWILGTAKSNGKLYMIYQLAIAFETKLAVGTDQAIGSKSKETKASWSEEKFLTWITFVISSLRSRTPHQLAADLKRWSNFVASQSSLPSCSWSWASPGSVNAFTSRCMETIRIWKIAASSQR